MDKLFIIGNGFDCYCHEMQTKYEDFRKYLISKFPLYKSFEDVPEKYLALNHKEFIYDENEIVGYIIKALDICEGEKWKSIEEALGRDIFAAFEYDLIELDFEDKDEVIHNAITGNNVLGENISSAISCLKKYFYGWVNNDLKLICYSQIKERENYNRILKGNQRKSQLGFDTLFYINFNYTYTLEEVYKIPSNQIWHIHGKIGDPIEKIYFGHGNEETFESNYFWGVEASFNELLKCMKKDTKGNIEQNKEKFQQYKNVKEIYSVGFSFSEVDMPYIDEICKCIDVSKVTWYFNQYDSKNNEDYLELIRKKGFDIGIEDGW